jgi:hypothetical protein
MTIKNACYDPETIQVMKAVPEESWASLQPEQQRNFVESDLAQRILAAAVDGERDPIRLREQALATSVATSTH